MIVSWSFNELYFFTPHMLWFCVSVIFILVLSCFPPFCMNFFLWRCDSGELFIATLFYFKILLSAFHFYCIYCNGVIWCLSICLFPSHKADCFQFYALEGEIFCFDLIQWFQIKLFRVSYVSITRDLVFLLYGFSHSFIQIKAG
jgi:hypothetical protein